VIGLSREQVLGKIDGRQAIVQADKVKLGLVGLQRSAKIRDCGIKSRGK
jgi:hypothetical protein